MKYQHILQIILLCIAVTDAARILAVLPAPFKSHFASSVDILKEMVGKGHEVVSISPYDIEGLGENYTWVPIEVISIKEAVPNFDELSKKKRSMFEKQMSLWNTMYKYSEHISKLPKLKKFIEEDNSKFDLMLMEEFMCDFLLVFAYKYKTPLVMISTFGSAHYINQYMGNAYELSYVPHEFIELFGELNFFDRASNVLFTLFDLTFKKYYSSNIQNELAKRTFSHLPDAPDVADIRANASVTFLNSHFSMSGVRPFLPNIVEIGGVHIKEAKPLDQKLEQIMNKATKGVILVSFGSIMDLSKRDTRTVTQFLKALSRLDETVILKWANDTAIPIESKNIHGLKWFPQNDLLAHPKTKAFITHGGLLSVQETTYHGVPILCIPLFGNQPLICKKAVLTGYALSLDINNIEEEVLYKTTKELVTNPQYSKKAKELSSRFRDRPNTARDTAVYWMEYVIRHKGADFIRSPKRNLYWFQAIFLDILAVVIICLLLVYKLIMFICKSVFKKPEKIKKN